ncbi:MAG: hypothetical protein HKP61_07880 [Dactylosporangium sp.]|nr:hypothetical protein [Dactylosporangium sp.]NNJ60855.1 hypothetical protein [Dactylosporangium sp.]
MGDLLVNLLASVIAGCSVWLAQRGLRRRTLARRRTFFGVVPGEHCLLVVGKHASSPSEHSVSSRDVAALVELATVVRSCGGHADLAIAGSPVAALGRQTEFCVGGPITNPRTAVHLRTMLPGVRFEHDTFGGPEMAWWVGDAPFRWEPERVTYVVMAKVFAPGSTRAVFIVAGQVAAANLAAARFLATRFESLASRYGVSRQFCLVLRVAEPAAYGSDFVEVAADVTDAALSAPA